MKLIKVPDWWDSVRAILALGLTATTCWAVIWGKDILPANMSILKDLTMMADTFYFVLKKRPEENGNEKTTQEK